MKAAYAHIKIWYKQTGERISAIRFFEFTDNRNKLMIETFSNWKLIPCFEEKSKKKFQWTQ